jgi:glycosyltransferase involved in cell wall biosynthesis
MIRIAYIIDTIATPNAGTEKQLLMLLHGLDRTEFEPTLICLRPSEWLQRQSFPFDVHILDLGAILRPSMLGAIARFKTLDRAKRFDIVQTFFVDANIFGTIAAHRAGVRTIISCRRNIGHWHTGVHTTLLRFLRRWTTHYLANSKAVLDVSLRREGVSADRITVIYNGLDLSCFETVDPSLRRRQRQDWHIAPDQTLVGVVANLRPVKNLPSFIGAAAELKDAYPNARFVVVGEGPDRADLQTRIDAAGLNDRVLLAGAHSDVLPCLAAFDIAVQCSFSESFSGALVEYMAAGLPIAASRVGGNPEAITSGATGLLYESDDGPNLAACLKQLLTDSAAARALGAAARSAAFERYSREACIRKHQQFYREMVDKVKQI